MIPAFPIDDDDERTRRVMHWSEQCSKGLYLYKEPYRHSSTSTSTRGDVLQGRDYSAG